MKFWSKIGLASYQDIKKIEVNQNKIEESLNKLQEEQRKAVLDLNENLLNNIIHMMNSFTEQVTQQNRGLEEQIDILMKDNAVSYNGILKRNRDIMKSQKELDNRMKTIEEIVKIHWANVLLDHVDLVLEEMGSNKK